MSALAAAYKMLFTRLNGWTPWGARVYSDFAPENTPRPYVVYFLSGGGDEYHTQQNQNARLVFGVKCVADTMREAFAGAAVIEGLLRDQGTQESGNVPAVDGWAALTITQDTTIHLVERYEGAKPIYHEGHQYEFFLEK